MLILTAKAAQHPWPSTYCKKRSGRACSSDINLSSCQFSNLHQKLRGVIIILININRKPHCDFAEYLSFRSNIAPSCARVTSDSEYTCIYQEKYIFLLYNRLSLRKPRPFNLNVIQFLQVILPLLPAPVAVHSFVM